MMPNAPATGNQVTTLQQMGVIAMLQAGTPIRETAKNTGLATKTVHAIKHNKKLWEKFGSCVEVESLKKQFIEDFAVATNMFLRELNPAKIRALKADRIMIGAATAYDKFLLASGQPTQRIKHEFSVSELDRQIEEKRREIGELAKKADIVIDVDAIE
jgi:hypothetical protein